MQVPPVRERVAILIVPLHHQQIACFFEFRGLGTLALKGLPHPVPAWEVLEVAAVESRFEALRSDMMTPFVGREEELDLLQRRWLRAMSGDGQMVLLSGEPGIGKSRLIGNLVHLLSSIGAAQFDRHPPFHSRPRLPRGHVSTPMFGTVSNPRADISDGRPMARPCAASG
jgi:hypothetical protein